MGHLKVLMTLRAMAELLALIDRAFRTGQRQISLEEIEEGFDRADAAELLWRKAEGKSPPPEGDGP